MVTESGELARLVFEGERYAQGGMDTTAMKEVIRFDRIVTEIAKTLWRRDNPTRERLPKGFGLTTQLCFDAIGAGSLVVPLKLRNTAEPCLFPTTAEQAVQLVRRTFAGAHRDEPPPEAMSRNLLPELVRLGEDLPHGSRLRLAVPGHTVTPVSRQARAKLREHLQGFYPDDVDIAGRVLEVNARHRRFQLWPESGGHIQVAFTPQQETEVMSALVEHRSVRVRVRGRGDFDFEGTLRRVSEVASIAIVPPEEPALDAEERPIHEIFAEIFSDVPDEVWDRLPSDLSHRHDHYLYGSDDE